MIENSTNELRGQTELSDFLPRNEPPETAPEGYDSEGHLLNEDYGMTPQKPSPGASAEAGEGGAAQGDKPDGFIGRGATATAESEIQTPHRSAVTDEVVSLAAAPRTSAVPAAASERLTALAGEIAAITEHARVVLASAAIDIGKRLIEAKGLVQEGRWGEWLEKNVDYSDRQAQVMMQLADQFGRGELPEAFRGLGISHMTALLAAPAEEREALARRVEDEGLSVRGLKEEVKRLREKAKDAEQVSFDLEYSLNATRRQMEDIEAERDTAAENLKAVRAAIEKEREAVRLAQAKATAAEASAEELRRLHSDAEDRAAASAQRASDAVNRANQTAKDLAEARSKIARLEAEAAQREAEAPVVKRVEVVPEEVQKELSDLRAQLAEAQAALQKPSPLGEGGAARSAVTDEVVSHTATASEKFKWFYANQMKPTFTSALTLLREVAQEDAKAADLFATALVKGCQQLMNQLGERD